VEPETVLDAVRLLEAEGYSGDFVVGEAGVHGRECRVSHVAEHALVDRVYRFEGPSDPDEEAIVFALRCPACDVRGTLVSGFGPGADPAVMERLVMLRSRFRT
jgi:hypothetical protein